MKYKITPYSSYNNWTFKEETENVSDIIDKLIRLSAKCTECFAGDIIYTIRKLELAVENHAEMCDLLLFREHGINAYPMESKDEFDNGANYLLAGVQLWVLTHNPETTTTTLMRVEARGDGHYVGYPT